MVQLLENSSIVYKKLHALTSFLSAFNTHLHHPQFHCPAKNKEISLDNAIIQILETINLSKPHLEGWPQLLKLWVLTILLLIYNMGGYCKYSVNLWLNVYMKFNNSKPI